MILIYGKGKTGEAVKRFLDIQKKPYIIMDDKDNINLDDVELIVVSPGIPFYHEIYKKANLENIPIISEIEFADSYFKGKKIAVTGTDGKTTTTSLIYHILNDEKEVYIGGNYGIPFIDIVNRASENSVAILELSSFQLYSTKNFKPDIAVFLNVSKDHLDWHKRFCHYLLSKYKITKNQTESDYLILNYDDDIVSKINSNADRYYFSLRKLPADKKGIYVTEYNRKNGISQIRFRLKLKEDKSFQVNSKLIGMHNVQNIMASFLAAYLYGLDVDHISQKISTFQPLPHRIEFVKEINGIKFYNDSKATTVQAVMRALESFDGNIILILGGINKGGDFSILGKVLKEKVKKVFLIGKSKDEIEGMIKEFCLVEKVEKFEDAVKGAYRYAEKSDIVLLSPGCASFDMFKSYTDRGERFKEIVKSLDG